MAEYTLSHTGAEIDSAVTKVENNKSKGSATKPVYFDSNGTATVITSYEGNAASATKATQDGSGRTISSTYARKSSTTTATMSASEWTSSNTYSFEGTYPVASYNIEIEVAPTATKALYKAFSKAMIVGSSNSNIVTAINGKPTVDIPIIITSEALA